ncbi:MAG: cell division protein ZapA [Erythrobacter cryptus]
MSTVTLTIGPKSYAVACADGQEPQLEALGAMVAEKYAQIGAARAPLEAQNLLFAALFLADELNELRWRAAALEAVPRLEAEIARLEAELAEAQRAAAAAAPVPAPEPTAAPPPTSAAAIRPQGDLFAPSAPLGELAERLEALAAEAEASAAALEALIASA